MFNSEELHKQIEQNYFQLYFSPRYDTASSKTIRNETVVRYNDSLISMDYKDFLQELESKDLIGILDIWVLNQVCKLQKYREAMQEEVSAVINVSAKTLCNPYYVYDIALILKKYDLPQDMIQIEVISTIPYNVTYGMQKGLLFLQRQGIKLIYSF